MAYRFYEEVLMEWECPPRKQALKLALLALCAHHNAETDLSFVGMRKIAIVAGVEPDRVKDLVKELVDEGFIALAGYAKRRADRRWVIIETDAVRTGKNRLKVWRLQVDRIQALIAEQIAKRKERDDPDLLDGKRAVSTSLVSPQRGVCTPPDNPQRGVSTPPVNQSTGGLHTTRSCCQKVNGGCEQCSPGGVNTVHRGVSGPPITYITKKNPARVCAPPRARTHEGGGGCPDRLAEFTALVAERAGGWGQGWRDRGDRLIAPTGLHRQRVLDSVGEARIRALGYREISVAASSAPHPGAGQ